MKKEKLLLPLMVGLTACLFVLNLFVGSVSIPFSSVWEIIFSGGEGNAAWQYIVWESRLPQALTALLCGAALAVSGLMLQTVFRNPLAGPSILGIDSGAGLGVALVMLLGGGTLTAGTMELSGFVAVTVAAFLGALAVMGLLLFLSTFLRNDLLLLIVGILVGYAASSVISLLNFFATSEGVHSYTVWGMGSFGGVSLTQIPLFALLVGAGLLIALLLIKPLNALLLGGNYAANLGIDVRRTRLLLLLATGLLSAATTAFCGPISFLGLAVPHMARLLLGSADHRRLLPLTLFTGSGVALLCNLLCTLPGDRGIIPLAAVTPLLGVPVILWVLLRGRR